MPMPSLRRPRPAPPGTSTPPGQRMECQLIMAVSSFPSIYNTSSLSYRDANMRIDAWRQVAEIVGVPEIECRKKWKTLRDRHRKDRQRERKIRESGIGSHNYRPWRYASILAFLNPFLDVRAAGSSHMHAAEYMGGSTTVETRSDDHENYGFSPLDECNAESPSSSSTSSSSSSSSSSAFSSRIEFRQRKRSSSAQLEGNRLKEPKIEVLLSDDGMSGDQSLQIQEDNANMKEVWQAMLPSVTSLSTPLAPSYSSSQLADRPDMHQTSPPQPQSWSSSRLNHLKTTEKEGVELLTSSDEEELEPGEVPEKNSGLSSRLKETNRSSMEGQMEESLRKMEKLSKKKPKRKMETQRVRELEQGDDVILFLLSLAPAMRRLTAEKQSWVRTKIQQFIHETQFGPTDFH